MMVAYCNTHEKGDYIKEEIQYNSSNNFLQILKLKDNWWSEISLISE